MQQRTGQRWRQSIAMFFSWLLLITWSLEGRAIAEAGPLRAEVLPLAMRPRTAAPTFVDVKLYSRQQSILQGVLELQVLSMGELQFRQQTREIALAPGATTQRILIPPSKSATDVRLLFLSGKKTYDLGQFPLSSGYSSGRQYLIGICGSSAPIADTRPRLWQALRPESIVPKDAKGERQVTSVPVWISPDDLPNAIGLCAFDLLVIESRSFNALESQQLDQLATWLEAGGSLCIAPQGPLPAEHLAFLKKYSDDPRRPPTFVPEADGTLRFRGGPNIVRQPGLGQIAIVTESPATEAEITAHPWATVLEVLTRQWRSESSTVTTAHASRTSSSSRPYLAQGALMGLLPKTSRSLPVSLVIALLGTFILLVGPGEWIVLGRLRKRRWTWVTFPVLAFLFALAAVRAAEHYLGRTNRQSELIITDLGEAGRVLRQNRLTLHFAGSSTTTAWEVRQGIGVSCAFEMGGRGRSSEETVALYQGTIPSQYSMRQHLKQWSPHLSRSMTLRGDAPLPKTNWENINLGALSNESLPATRLWVEQLRQQGWSVQFLSGSQVSTIELNARERIPYQQLVEGLSKLPEGDPTVAPFSPTGSGNLLDLAILNPDSGDLLVVATKVSQQTLHMVRRIYRPGTILLHPDR